MLPCHTTAYPSRDAGSHWLAETNARGVGDSRGALAGGLMTLTVDLNRIGKVFCTCTLSARLRCRTLEPGSKGSLSDMEEKA